MSSLMKTTLATVSVVALLPLLLSSSLPTAHAQVTCSPKDGFTVFPQRLWLPSVGPFLSQDSPSTVEQTCRSNPDCTAFNNIGFFKIKGPVLDDSNMQPNSITCTYQKIVCLPAKEGYRLIVGRLWVKGVGHQELKTASEAEAICQANATCTAYNNAGWVFEGPELTDANTEANPGVCTYEKVCRVKPGYIAFPQRTWKEAVAKSPGAESSNIVVNLVEKTCRAMPACTSYNTLGGMLTNAPKLTSDNTQPDKRFLCTYQKVICPAKAGYHTIVQRLFKKDLGNATLLASGKEAEDHCRNVYSCTSFNNLGWVFSGPVLDDKNTELLPNTELCTYQKRGLSRPFDAFFYYSSDSALVNPPVPMLTTPETCNASVGVNVGLPGLNLEQCLMICLDIPDCAAVRHRTPVSGGPVTCLVYGPKFISFLGFALQTYNSSTPVTVAIDDGSIKTIDTVAIKKSDCSYGPLIVDSVFSFAIRSTFTYYLSWPASFGEDVVVSQDCNGSISGVRGLRGLTLDQCLILCLELPTCGAVIYHPTLGGSASACLTKISVETSEFDEISSLPVTVSDGSNITVAAVRSAVGR